MYGSFILPRPRKVSLAVPRATHRCICLPLRPLGTYGCFIYFCTINNKSPLRKPGTISRTRCGWEWGVLWWGVGSSIWQSRVVCTCSRLVVLSSNLRFGGRRSFAHDTLTPIKRVLSSSTLLHSSYSHYRPDLNKIDLLHFFFFFFFFFPAQTLSTTSPSPTPSALAITPSLLSAY